MGKKIWIDVSERGRAGGKARALAMDPQQRSDAARKAVNKRWDDVRALTAAKQRDVAAKQAKVKAKRKAGRGKGTA